MEDCGGEAGLDPGGVGQLAGDAEVGVFLTLGRDAARAEREEVLVARATIALHPAVSIGRDVVGREVGHQLLPQGWCGVCDESRAFFSERLVKGKMWFSWCKYRGKK